MKWKTTKPPKRKVNPVKLRYQSPISKRVYVGNFVWDDKEKAWIECEEGWDAIGLYEEDDWKILGWK